MSPLTTRLLLMGALVLVLANPGAHAQGEVTIEALSFPKVAGHNQIEILIGKGKTEILKIPSHTLGEPIKVPRLASWNFGVSGEDAEGKFTFKTYGQVRPLAARRQLLVFLRKGNPPAAGFRIVALDGSMNGFGEKKFMIMNLARQEIAGEIGGKKFRLPPAKHVILEPAPNRGKNLCYATLMYQRKEKWRSFFSTNWPVLKDNRGLVFIYQNQRNGTMQMHSIVDSLKKIPPPKPPG